DRRSFSHRLRRLRWASYILKKDISVGGLQDRLGCNGKECGHSHPAIMLRILVLAPGSNPGGITGPLIGYSHAEALARLHSVTLVIRHRNEAAVRRKEPGFQAIEVISLPWLHRIHTWSFRWAFKNNYRSQVLTAFSYLFCSRGEWGRPCPIYWCIAQLAAKRQA